MIDVIRFDHFKAMHGFSAPPILVQACETAVGYRDYSAKLITGEVLHFTSAIIYDHCWVRLINEGQLADGMDYCDVALSAIVWAWNGKDK